MITRLIYSWDTSISSDCKHLVKGWIFYASVVSTMTNPPSILPLGFQTQQGSYTYKTSGVHDKFT